ncbi:Hint domain-containing protein [Rhodovulum sp.]|uniref:Hint domain-containing protein n=1 Tax=Rhodovulum sp. TaxID=34009 RepID=UPI0018283914|nr:Hint domain-containing protein [Rhodovulum sp.]HDR28643.1 hypothetical protein [Rhodovulum sp.]
MATCTLGGYAVSQFLIEGGGPPDIGARFMLEPDFVAEADRLIITVTNDGGIFHGSANTVPDNTQSATITNAGGDTLASGDVRLGYSTTLSSPAGGTITVYQVLVNGTLAGHVVDGQLEPGVTCLIANWSDTLLADPPDYNALSTPARDPGQDAVIQGGIYDDHILAGGDNDSVDGGDGSDTLIGGTGNDTIIGGAGDDRITTGGGSDLIVLEPGGGWDTVTDFDMTMIDGRTRDQLDGATLLDRAGNPVRARDVTIQDDGAGSAILVFPGGEKVTLLGVTPEQVAPIETLQAMGITCIGSGKRIDTPDDPRPFETLREGDAVLSRDARGLPVAHPTRFIAARRVETDEMTRTPRHAPIEIAAGALGPHGRLWRHASTWCGWVRKAAPVTA